MLDGGAAAAWLAATSNSLRLDVTAAGATRLDVTSHSGGGVTCRGGVTGLMTRNSVAEHLLETLFLGGAQRETLADVDAVEVSSGSGGGSDLHDLAARRREALLRATLVLHRKHHRALRNGI